MTELTLIDIFWCLVGILAVYLLYLLTKRILSWKSGESEDDEPEHSSDWKDAQKKVTEKLDDAAEHFKSITSENSEELNIGQNYSNGIEPGTVEDCQRIIREECPKVSEVEMKPETIENACTFVQTLYDCNPKFVPYAKTYEESEISVTNWGSIVLDIYLASGLVSMEIGGNQFGFFTDFTGTGNCGMEGTEIDFTKIPDMLQKVLDNN